MKKILLFMLCIIAWSSQCFANYHWVRPTGTQTTWTDCDTETATPPADSNSNYCTLATAFSSAVAGDLVYLRGGAYSGTTFYTTNSGSGNADSSRIIFKAYTGETPVITLTQSDYSCIDIRDNYWTFDGLTLHGTTTRTEAGVIGDNQDYGVTGTKIINCIIYHDGASTFDNVDAVILHSSNYALVQYNEIIGWSTSQNGGIILFNGTGNKILNNLIHGGAMGIYQKHPNCDTSLSTGAEIAYNYIYNTGSTGIGSCGGYINIHDNIVVASGTAFRWGEEAGTICGVNDGMVINHNTIKGNVYIVADEGIPNGTIKNNIMTGSLECYGCTMGSWTYNLLGWTQSGSNNINGSPTFVDGTNPSSIPGFALQTGSLGKNNADDSKDRGADTTLVGFVSSGCEDTTTPTCASDLCITSPTSNPTWTTAATPITLTGNASDDVAVTSVTWSNGLTGGSGTCTGTTSWSCASITLAAGNNNITVNIYDACNNVKSDQITVAYTPPTPEADECTNYTTNHPEWIYCDDFEGYPTGAPASGTGQMLTSGHWWDYSASESGSSFTIGASTGYNGTQGIDVLFYPGNDEHGSIVLSFGNSPHENGIETSTDYREVYWRFYMKLATGWSGYPDKLTRATMFTGSWVTNLMEHLWSEQTAYLSIDPSTCIDQYTGALNCDGYNQTGNYAWLGKVTGTTPIFDGNHNNTWYRIEVHIKLNTAGSSDGIFEYWIDGNLEARRTGLNFTDGYTTYAINAVSLENYGCGSCNSSQHRYFDNFVVSTQPIGAISNPTNPMSVITGLTITGGSVQ